jgi:hypothetical protein
MRRLLLVLAILLFASPASAFCGFYVSGGDAKLFNDATQVVLLRDGNRTVLSMQNAYKGPPEKFAMVVPVPVVLQKDNVKTLKKELFDKLDKLSAPRLVEYWEQDPCYVPPPQEARPMTAAPTPPMAAAKGAVAADLGVKIEAQFSVGEYEIVILSAKDAGGLDTWLRREKYNIPEGAEPYFKPYVQSGSKFFVARVDTTKVIFKDGIAELSPLRFHYDMNEFSLPVRLGLINSGGTQDLVIHIIAKNQRYEPANYPSVSIPTNIDLAEEAKQNFGAFYTQLFDRTLEKNPKAIVTEYAWGASSCDPCPGPTADVSDLMSLGGDVLTEKVDYHTWFATPWVVTRLHARYTKDSLGQDIVFRTAPPIAGGREMMAADGKLEHGTQPSSFNNFQGRYAIRHPWTGPIACKQPRRGIWGPPPGKGQEPPAAATKIAFAPRGGTPLVKLVRSDVPEIDMKSSQAPISMPTDDAGTPSSTDAPKKTGCAGCTSSTSPPSRAALLAATAALAILTARRRHRRRADW